MGASSGHITNFRQSIFETLDIYGATTVAVADIFEKNFANVNTAEFAMEQHVYE
jgi:hypothetical protein